MEPEPHVRKAGVARSVITGIALGLREVFDPEKRDTVVIEQEAPADPLEPQKVEVHLDPVDPRDSTAIYRPWLEDGASPPGPGPGSDAQPPGPAAAPVDAEGEAAPVAESDPGPDPIPGFGF